MIRISQLKLPANHTEQELMKAIQKNLKGQEILSWRIKKKSLDARKKQNLIYQYVIDVTVKGKEEKVIKALRNKKLSLAKEEIYQFPWKAEQKPKYPPE